MAIMSTYNDSRPLTFRAHPKGRRADPEVRTRVAAGIGHLPRRRDLLIEYLHILQDGNGHLRADELVALADLLALAPVEVYEVASFYHHFDVVDDGETPPPAATVRICTSLSCALAGGAALHRDCLRAFAPGVRVLEAPCIGRCDSAPAAVVGRRHVLHADAAMIAAALAAEHRDDPAPAAVDYAQARARGGYGQYARVAGGALNMDTVIAELEAAGLRGLGGAGFPVARKWRAVRAEATPRQFAVNVDEGEPGTFKDRHFLASDPHAFLEGMLIAAQAVEAATVHIYVRDEYHAERALLAREIAALCSDPPVPGHALPQIELRRGAGAYICGEESAMIESIEGKRGLPRLRPPYVAQRGLFGRPTLEHNLETLHWIPAILEHGGTWFAAQGRRGHSGMRAFSVSGRVARPGVHVAPAGITARELIDEFAGGMVPGHRLYAYLPGGASGGILPAALADLPLDFEALAAHDCFVGSGALIVLSQHDRASDAARNLLAFFRDESCGQCTPCRVGTAKAVELMRAPQWDAALLEELCAAMADASICGLGQAAPNPIRSVLRHFADEQR